MKKRQMIEWHSLMNSQTGEREKTTQIKITGADQITAAQTGDESGRLKVIYSLPNLPSEHWQNEFKQTAHAHPFLARSLRAIEFGGTKIIVECAADTSLEEFNRAFEEAVRQTNQQTEDVGKEILAERGAEPLIER
jgi:hypothetical protein